MAAKSGSATLRHVAKAAGVHLSTVSRVMNPATRHLITPAVVKKVLQSAEELGYRPNLSASSLRTRRSNAVGVIIADMNNPVFPPIMVKIEETLNAAGYLPIIANAGHDPARQIEVLHRLLSRQVDGIILATSSKPDQLIRDCQKAGVPIVLALARAKGNLIGSVASDNVLGCQLETAHLVALGHKRIALIAGPQSLSTGRDRRQGYERALAAAGFPAASRMIVEASSYTRDAGHACCAGLLHMPKRPTAIVAANDLLALGCYDAIQAAGLVCPRDISVVGYNDMPFMDLVSPPLTTVRLRYLEVGTMAAQMLLGKFNGTVTNEPQILLKPELVIRQSSAPPPKSGGAKSGGAASRR